MGRNVSQLHLIDCRSSATTPRRLFPASLSSMRDLLQSQRRIEQLESALADIGPGRSLTRPSGLKKGKKAASVRLASGKDRDGGDGAVSSTGARLERRLSGARPRASLGRTSTGGASPPAAARVSVTSPRGQAVAMASGEAKSPRRLGRTSSRPGEADAGATVPSPRGLAVAAGGEARPARRLSGASSRPAGETEIPSPAGTSPGTSSGGAQQQSAAAQKKSTTPRLKKRFVATEGDDGAASGGGTPRDRQ